MRLINGMTPVNSGVVVQFENSAVEVLGPGYSTHPIRIVNTYINDNGIKVELSYSGNRVGVYRFMGLHETQHYWSKSYDLYSIIEKPKYADTVKYLLRAYRVLFDS